MIRLNISLSNEFPYLEEVVVEEEPVPGGRGLHGDRVDAPLLELESDVARRILNMDPKLLIIF